MSASGDRVTYIIGTYPMLTTTFIDREVRMLQARGATIDIVALRRPNHDLSPEQASLAASTTYVRPVRPVALLRRHLRFVGASPRRYLSALGSLVGGSGQTMRERLRSIGHFGLAVYVAGELAETGGTQRIHAHFIDRAAALAHVAARLLDVPYSITAHASDIYVEPVLLEEKIQGADFVATCTGYNRRHLVDEVPGADAKVELLYHGLELHDYVPAPNGSHQAESAVPVLLAVGQLKEKKGFTDLIAACRVLVDKGVAFRCDVIGEGPQRGELEELIGALEVGDHITLRGALPHQEVIAAYRGAFAFVLPCVVADNGDRDGIPNVILEAMSMQLPVVSTRNSGIPEAVEHGATGLLVEPGDSDELAVALVEILQDPERSRLMGLAGRRVVEERFDAEANVQALFERFSATGGQQ